MNGASAAHMRRIEQLAVEQGSTYEELMERAGTGCARWLCSQPEYVGGAMVIVCGKGNNGGDGFVIARHLRHVAAITVILCQGKPTAYPAKSQYDQLVRLSEMADAPISLLDWEREPYLCSAAVRQASVVVDCIYGIGFHGSFPPALHPLLEQMNASTGYKVAVDMPSGLPADGEEPDGAVFRADHTLTFTAKKWGQNHPACGRVVVLDIGIPAAIVEEVLDRRTITAEWVASCLRPRPLDSHKGTYGRLLTVCGRYGMAGAALLCARGALRSGVGLVTAAVPQSVYPLLASALPEAVFLPLPEEDGCFSTESLAALQQAVAGATAVVLGCGMGTGEVQTMLVEQLCRYSTRPVVLDADGINAIRPHILTEEAISAPLILTPHPGEMARLLDLPIAQVQQQRHEIARRFADEYGVTLVLKGHRTLVAAPGRPLLENETGNPGMATGGSGDVLAGIIGALAAQGMDPYYAAACGVYIHGAAGDRAAARLSQHSMLPSDLIEELGNLFLQFEK